MINLELEPYIKQIHRWPKRGRFILAQYDSDSIIVYQAYKPSIATYAVKHGYFGGSFRLRRMTWIKPNFLWMMYRCGWASKPGQEVVLAIRIKRIAFDEILSMSVHSIYKPGVYKSYSEWKRQVSESEVRLQWDPDHDPQGKASERKAIQLGLRGQMIKKYSKDWIIDIQDITDFVVSHRQVASSDDYATLVTPKEDIYPVKDADLVKRLELTKD